MSLVHATPEQFKDWLINPPSEPKLVRVTPDIAYAALLFLSLIHISEPTRPY